MMYDSIIILGSTATGKTGIAIDLAKKLSSEVINADSMYIYKDLTIGTAKPTTDEMDGVKHHLIDFVNPEQDYNVSNYRSDAIDIIAKFREKNLIPIVVGGTGFYINSLINDYSYGESTHSDKLRSELTEKLNTLGKEYLYNYLMEIDPITAKSLHINDTTRIIRAIEIKLLSGKGKSEIINNYPKILNNPLIIGLYQPREILYERINKRVDIMIENGLIGEVKKLVDMGLTPNKCQSMKGIGYKEIFEYLTGDISMLDAIEKIKQHTRNYAKRQITWFKRYDNIHWFDSSADNSITDKILTLYYAN